MSVGLQVLGMALGVLGWLGTIVACALPLWKVSAFIGNNIITAQIYWEGLWMTCVVQSTGQMQCKVRVDHVHGNSAFPVKVSM